MAGLFYISTQKKSNTRTFSPFPEFIRPLFIVTLLALLSSFLLSCSKFGQEAEIYLIGVINPNKGTQAINRNFIEGLARFGYIAGKNTTFIEATNSAEVDKTLQQLLEKKADLIFTVTTPVTKLAVSATKNKGIPVLFALHDPVAAGVVKNLSNQDEDITGIMLRGGVPKALYWLLELSPEVKNIFVPVKFDTPAAKQSLEDLQAAAAARNVLLSVVEVSSQADIEQAFAENAVNTDAVFLVSSIFISTYTEKIINEAVRYKLPIGGGTSTFNKGATITFGVLAPKVGRQASRLAHLILQGTNTDNIPIETAEFFLVINMQTAHDAGITVSDDILMHADIVFPLNRMETP